MAGSGLVRTVVVFSETPGELVQAARTRAMTTNTKVRDLTFAMFSRQRGRCTFSGGYGRSAMRSR